MKRLSILAALLLIGPSALAQDYPNRTVTIVAPSAPGGLYSLFARLIGTKLEQRFGKSFIVENRPGAASVVGALLVARAVPDGYTLMVATSTTMAINVTLHKKLSYDPTTDLTPIALLARVPQVLVVNAALPIHSLADLVAYAKTTPGGLTFGSAGAGTTGHLEGELLKDALAIPMTHVPYKGMSPAINDVAGGHVAMMFTPIPFALPLVQAGKLRMLGINVAQRVEPIAHVPPLTETGLKDLDAAAWFMLVAPGKTPTDIIDKLHVELRALGNDPDIRQEYTRQGLIPVNSRPPDELKRFVRAEIVRWGEVVRRAGLAGTQ